MKNFFIFFPLVFEFVTNTNGGCDKNKQIQPQKTNIKAVWQKEKKQKYTHRRASDFLLFIFLFIYCLSINDISTLSMSTKKSSTSKEGKKKKKNRKKINTKIFVLLSQFKVKSPTSFIFLACFSEWAASTETRLYGNP